MTDVQLGAAWAVLMTGIMLSSLLYGIWAANEHRLPIARTVLAILSSVFLGVLTYFLALYHDHIPIQLRDTSTWF